MHRRNLAGTMVLMASLLFMPIPGQEERSRALGADGASRGGVSATVSLVADAEYYFPGETVTVDVDLSAATGTITGGQFFLEFDSSKLQFQQMVPGDAAASDPGNPFEIEVFEVQGIGTIDYAVGIPPGDSGTSADVTMAVITFEALATVCATSDLVEFRATDPPTRLTDDLGDPVDTLTVNLGPITIDGTRPSLTCPSNLTIECTSATDPGTTGTATTMDNCDPSPTLTFADDLTTTGCVGNSTIARTWTVEDDTGNVRQCVQTISVRDRTSPVITCPADITTNAEPGTCTVSLDPGSASGTDNCDSGFVIVGTREDVLPLVGDYEVGTTVITWEATDCAGNSDVCQQSITVQDQEMPQITCPADVMVNADAGGTDAFVNIPPPPSLADNCGILSVTNDYNGTPNASDTYPQGPTTVTWTVQDVFGNEATCFHTVTVSEFNEMSVSVQLSPTVSSSLNRCITFELFDCGSETSEEVAAVIPFSFGLSLETTVLVPAGAWECMTARDRLHTLRRTADNFRIVGTRYVASFTGNVASGGDWLVGGNLNDDGFIDILDFGLLSMEWGAQYDSNGDMTPDGHTTCATAGPHADVSGNGVVNLGDFTFIQINFLKRMEPDCCGLRGGDAWGEPLASILVADLPADLKGMALADVTRDGVIDQADIAHVIMYGFPETGDEDGAALLQRPVRPEAADRPIQAGIRQSSSRPDGDRE